MLIQDTMLPFYGVIENINDPEKLDRVQVRCYGYHTDNKAMIPTDRLVWFQTGISGQAGNSGLGTNHTYVQGDLVFGYFIDKNQQQGFVVMSIKGQMVKPDKTKGFSDPNDEYPFYNDESDVNRIARNDNINKTIIDWKIKNRVTGIPNAKSGSWSEPVTEYKTVYPNNKVFETRSGHVVEYDDTPGAERISINHKTGSFEEIHPDGKRVTKSMGDEFEICLGNRSIYINGNVTQFVNGNVQQNITGEYYINAGSVVIDADIEIRGNSTANDHISSGVSGKDHTHTQGNDSDGNRQVPTNKPSGGGGGLNKTDVKQFSFSFEPFDPNIRK